jgi:hypothetical protein
MGCHNATSPTNGAPGFVDTTPPSMDASKAWTTINGMNQIVGNWSSTVAIITTPSPTASTPHYATYTASEAQAVTQWIALESAWRNTGGTTQVDLLAQWSGCMQFADFQTANMENAWANMNAPDGNPAGTCKQCHANGDGASYFVASTEEDVTPVNPTASVMFNYIATNRAYLSTFFTIDTTKTPNVVTYNLAPFKVAAEGLTASGAHPMGFDPTNGAGPQALMTFYQSTLTHLQAFQAGNTTACAPSTLQN